MPEEDVRSSNEPNVEDRSLESVQFDLQPTGLSTLDRMLNGGMPMGSTVLVAGPSGAGKTMFCTHWLFAGYEKYEENGLYISLTEPISKLMKHQKANAFFKQDYIDNGKIQFKDLRLILEHEKLETRDISQDDVWKIVDEIGKMVVDSGAKRVILDSVTALCYRLESRDLIRHFIFSLGTTLAYLDATVLLTSEVAGEGYSIFGVEEFICDGILRLHYDDNGNREFKIVKLRGHEYNPHPAKFQITTNGLRLYPVEKHNMDYQASSERVKTGIAGLDEMTSGGYIKGSTVLVSGPSGAGKSILTQHLIEHCAQENIPALHVSFEESKSEIIRNAQAFGWDREAQESQGVIKMVNVSPEAMYLEAHFQSMQRLIENNNTQVVIVDSLSALDNAFDSESLYNVCKRFISFCKTRGVTTFFTVASGKLVGTEKSDNDLDMSTLTDSILMLRYVEINSELKHGLLILKMRSSEHDRRMREIKFTKKGMFIADAFSGYEGVMTGNAKRVSGADQEKLYSLFLEMLGESGDDLFNQIKQRGLTKPNITATLDEILAEQIISQEDYDQFMERVDELLT